MQRFQEDAKVTFHKLHLTPAIRKNNNFFRSYNMLVITKLNHSFTFYAPVDDWKMKTLKLL